MLMCRKSTTDDYYTKVLIELLNVADLVTPLVSGT